MSVFATPSIARQRIVLVVFAACVAAAAGWQHASKDHDYPAQIFVQTKLPANVSSIDFTNAEAAWSTLQFDAQGRLQIDALTESALADAISLMTSEAATARVGFLLEKQFGAHAGQQIMELLPKLKRYKEAEHRWWLENASEHPPHAQLFQLQDELLGEALAAKLFSQQRRLVDLMLATHRIRNDANLTEQEKEAALLKLQTAPEDAALE